MTYEIKRLFNGGETVIKVVRPTGTQTKRAMGESVVDMSFVLPEYIDFKINDFVSVYGEIYKINVTPVVKKVATRKYEYQIQFEHLFYDLAKVQLQFLNPQNQLLEPVFNLMGNAATIVGLIVENANRHSPGWTVGVVDETAYQNFNFNAENCLQVLNRLASDFDTEFWIENKTIHLQKREQSSGLLFEYGKGRGLYSIFRGNKSNTNIVTRLYVRGGSKNLPTDYRNFATSLLLPGGATYIQDDNKVNPQTGYGLIEATQVFDTIYPQREGAVTAVFSGDGNWDKFTDASIDFDVNDYLLSTPAKIAFNTGQLAGYEFQLKSYSHATKQFVIAQNTDDNLTLPTNLIRPAVGDKYILIDIRMPQSYVDAAESKLLTAAQAYYNKNSDPSLNFTYSVECDPIWFRDQNVNVVLGNTVIIFDNDLGINGEIRIAAYKRDLQIPSKYELEISDSIGANEIIRQYAQQQRTLQLIESSGLLDINQIRKNIFLNRLSEQDGYLMLSGTKIKSGFADQAAIAARALIADHAVFAELANRAYTSDYALDSDKWDGRQFADYLDQPVRVNDPVRHKSLSSPSYVSGATGHGFKINEDGSAEFDSVSIRKELNVVTLNIREITGNGGSIAVTNVAEILTVTEFPDFYACFINTDNDTIFVPFHIGDYVRCQVWDGKGIKYYTARVRAVSQALFDLDKASFVGAGRPAAGDKVFQFGSDADASRQGLIYMTNSDTGAPYIDVLDGVNSADLTGKTKARLGKLNGITDNVFGNLSGYGLYSQNAYLRGQFWVTGGNAETKDGAQAKADAVKVGNRNILSFSNRLLQKTANMTDYMFGGYDIVATKRPLEIGKEYTLVVSGKHSGAGAIGIYVDGYQQIVWLGFDNDEGIKRFYFTADEIAPQRSRILFYNVPFGTHDLCTINWAVLYEGRITNPSLDWTPAPEDRITDIEVLKSETTTSLQVLDDKIATKVTLNEVTQEVNNVKIGSVNLLNNSIDFRESFWNSGFMDNGGGYVIDNNILYNRKPTLRTRVGTGVKHPTIYLENGVEYTYSALVYADGNNFGYSDYPLHLQPGVNGANEGKIKYIHWDTDVIKNQWKLIYVTFKLTEDANSVNPFLWAGGGIWDAFLNVAYLKLEIGNKPTDGSPSESDAQFKINTVTNRIVSAETQINQNAQLIQLKADRSEVVSMISDIQIGGTNYYSNLYTDISSYLITGVHKDTPESPNGFILTGEPTGYGNLRMNNVINSNGEWTVSGWVRGDQFVIIGFSIDICDQGLIRFYTNDTNDWVYFTHTVNVTNYSLAIYNFVDFGEFNYAYYIFKDIKVEKGNKATDWTPSPRDTAGQIQNLTTRVNAAELMITPAAINATVSQQIDTKTANVLNDSKVYTNSQVSILNGMINLKADQTTVDNLGTRLSEAEIKITPEAINLTVSQQVDRKSLASSWGAGKSLYTDTTFLVAANGTYRYNNDHSGAQPLYTRFTRQEFAASNIFLPSTSTHGMYYEADGRHTTSPGWGGFYWATPSRANAKFIVRMIIAFSAGRIIEFQSNSFGTGSRHTWLTSNEGAGTTIFKEYICYVECGSTGTFDGTNFFSFAGGDGVAATIAFAGVFDITDYNDLPTKEQIKSSFVMTPNSISMLGKSIDMTGQVTFSSLDSGAQSSINNAQVTASQAQSAANAAVAAADAAQTTANVANSAAVGAQGSANAAQNTANVANSAAVGAQSSANAAQNTANIANAAANAAQGAANSANSVIANWSWNNDVTVIDGGKIVANTIAGDRIIAGTLAADRIVNGSLTSQQINVTELLAQNVTASGTITATNLIVTGSSKIGGFIIEDDYLTSVPSGGVYTGKLTLKPKTLQWDAVTQEYIGGQFVIRSSDLNINKDGSILKISRYNNHTLNKGLEIDMGVNGTAINILSGAIIVDGNSGFTGKVPFNQNQNTRYLNITNGIITSITNN